MNPDEESNLKPAFAELHRRQREQAPPFGAMYQRAMRQANDRRHLRMPSPVVGRIAWTAIAAGVAAGMWWFGHWSKPPQSSSGERVDELIAAIEQQLERSEPSSFSEFPTDILLTENQSDPAL